MRKPFLLAVLAYLVPSFAVGYAWHLVAFHDVYARLEIYRPDPVIPFGLASMLVQGLIFAWAFPRLFDTARGAWAKSALRAGLVYALLSWSFTTVAVSAKHPMSSVDEYFLMESLFTILQFTLVAPLMALAWRGAPSTTRLAPSKP